MFTFLTQKTAFRTTTWKNCPGGGQIFIGRIDISEFVPKNNVVKSI